MKSISYAWPLPFVISRAGELYRECHAATNRERRKRPKRFDVINALLERTADRRYLEIGVRNPDDCFHRIHATYKLSVDPGYEDKVNRADFHMTSDEFFSKLDAGSLVLEQREFDVIFIDGLHRADQAYRDIRNAMQWVADVGYIVLHDCNPPTRHHAREVFRERGPAGPAWNGTTWKAFQRIRTEVDKNCYVIDCDWGVGVIENHGESAANRLSPEINAFYEYSVLDENREMILNLVQPEDLTWLTEAGSGGEKTESRTGA
ncbi:MAG: class I SAM-dependent methyltransferase [Arenicellales bacterium]|jgi:hypothetical protein